MLCRDSEEPACRGVLPDDSTGHRSWYFSQKIVPVARQVWRAFCRHGTIFIGCRRDRDTSLIDGREIVPVDEVGKRHWRSVAVHTISEPEICQGAEFLLQATVRIRVPDYVRAPSKWLRVMQKA